MEAKRKPPKKRRPRRWIIGLFIILLLAGGTAFVLTSKHFVIQYVNVEGNTLLTDREVVGKMGPVGGNIFLYSPKEAILNLQKVEGIQEVKIDKEIPNRINVLIREAFVLARIKGDPPHLLDNQGIVLESGDTDVISGRVKPLKVVWEKGKIETGKAISDDPRDIDLLTALLKTKISENIKQVNFDKSGNIDIIYKDILVHFGKADDIFKKINNLTAALKEIRTKSISAKEIIIKDGKEMIVVTENKDADTEK